MASRKSIISLPHPSLRQKSRKLRSISSDTKKLIEDMQAATLDWEDNRKHEAGVALAAVQINRLERVIIIRNSFENKKDRSFSVFINPQIIKHSNDVIEDFEGCLSVKNIYGKVPRYNKVKIKALDENGQEVRVNVDGFLARVFQHEIDHTNGVLFIDHIKDSSDAFFHINTDGKLKPLDYEKDVKNNNILWQ